MIQESKSILTQIQSLEAEEAKIRGLITLHEKLLTLGDKEAELEAEKASLLKQKADMEAAMGMALATPTLPGLYPQMGPQEVKRVVAKTSPTAATTVTGAPTPTASKVIPVTHGRQEVLTDADTAVLNLIRDNYKTPEKYTSYSAVQAKVEAHTPGMGVKFYENRTTRLLKRLVRLGFVRRVQRSIYAPSGANKGCKHGMLGSRMEDLRAHLRTNYGTNPFSVRVVVQWFASNKRTETELTSAAASAAMKTFCGRGEAVKTSRGFYRLT